MVPACAVKIGDESVERLSSRWHPGAPLGGCCRRDAGHRP